MQIVSAVPTFCFCMDHRLTSAGTYRPECVLKVEYASSGYVKRISAFCANASEKSVWKKAAADRVCICRLKIRLNSEDVIGVTLM